MVTNTLLMEENQACLRASFLVKLGSLSIYRAVQVALSAYLASVAFSTVLVHNVYLPPLLLLLWTGGQRTTCTTQHN